MPPDTLPQPLYFGDAATPLFGWWHAPRGAQRDLAVVLCPALGREEECSHRSLRVWAERMAAAGLPVLRFDLPGTGDSHGDAAMPHRVAAWQAAVDAAVNDARRLSALGRVALVGLRVGALLAVERGVARGDIEAIVAAAAVTSGRAHLRELKALQAASATPGTAPAAAGWIEAGGYAITPDQQEALTALDLRAPARAPASQMLLLDRDDMPGQERWAEALRALGAQVERQAVPGYAAMMQDPHNSRVPQAMIDASVAWLLAHSTSAGEAARLTLPRSAARFGAVTERPVRIDGLGGVIESIVTEPAHASTHGGSRSAVLLLNAGAQRRSGPSRQHTTLARRWAAAGATVMRIDLMGLGDSVPPAGEPDHVVYPDSAVMQVQHALAALKAQGGFERCVVVGLCAGAYHALKAAVAAPGIDVVVAINPLTFFWRPDMPLDAPLPAHKVMSEMARYRQGLWSWQRWRKLLRGQVDVQRLWQVLSRRLAARVSRPLRELARTLHLPVHDDLAHELQLAVRHGATLQFVFAEGDPGDALLQEQGGRAVARLQREGRLAIHRIAQADHTFTGSVARAALQRVLDGLVLGEAAGADPLDSPVHRMAAEAAAP